MVLVSGDFVPFGGMDAGNWALAKHLACDESIELHLVAHRIHDDIAASANVRFHKVNKPLNSNFLGFPCLAIRARKVIKRHMPDRVRVLVNGANTMGQDASWVHYLHAVHEPIPGARLSSRFLARIHHTVYLECERRWLPHNKTIFANSLRTKQDIISHYSIDPHRVHVIYYGSDPARFHPSTQDERSSIRQDLGVGNDELVAIFIGALGDRRKGFDVVYEAWNQLHLSHSLNIKLLVVGTGKDVPHWELRAQLDGLDQKIQFLGFRKDVEKLLAMSDLMVHPARYEAYGLAVQEALCCGVPAIVSANAGVVERFSDGLKSLQLRSADSVEELVDALKLWSARRSEFSAQAMRIGERLREVTWNRMAQSLTSVWLYR